MRIFIRFILVVALAIVSFQLFKLYRQKSDLSGRLEKLDGQTALIDSENQKIERDIEYYENPENLSKELKSKFDFKRPGEKIYIVIPKR